MRFKRKTIRVITWGGLGDILLSTPSFKALKKKYPGCRILVFCKQDRHKLVYEGNPHIDQIRSATFWGNPIHYCLYYLKMATFYVFDYEFLYPSFTYEKNATEIIAEMLDVELEDKRVQLFLTKKEEDKARELLAGYKTPIVIHMTSLTSENQEWSRENWENLIRTMPDYTFIQLGLPDEEKIDGAVDFRGKTSIREAFAVIKYSSGFMGINSSLSHVSNAFNIPGVVLFGASNPEIWGHPNHTNIYKKIRCSPCVDMLYSAICPYGRTCMHSITVEEVRSAMIRKMEQGTRSAVEVFADPVADVSL
ncbi:MAG TPA: glycosyltransferase family 9 protein [Puia sp.]|nr:glycosyltransferase family 9 protein [Puia sp.]